MKFYQVDSFTNEAFKGNPAGVCLLDKYYEDSILQNIAMEMNLSETAFLEKLEDNEYKLRWFTPETEVDLCGHGTLAAAFILWTNNIVEKKSKITFRTLSGNLIASKEGDWIVLDFPAYNINISNGDENLINSLNIKPIDVYEDNDFYILEYEYEEDIINLKPDFNILNKADKREIIVTSKSNKDSYNFISRFFAPALGINEDPVTGSAHCYLAPFWAKKLNMQDLIGFQASKRTGFVKCRVIGERVLLYGNAKLVLEGKLHI